MSENQNTPKKYYNPSALMTAYNHAKSYGRETKQFDVKRVDRALGLLMSGELQNKVDEYKTTINDCGCPDWQYRTLFCKHRIGLMIEMKHDQIMEDEIWQYQEAV